MAGDAVTLHGALPLYERIAILDARRHGDRALLPGEARYRFAGAAPLIAVTTDEFERAALDYPILFFAAEREAVVVTGLSADRNLFVAPDGRYAPGAYVPAYLRRHPFTLARREHADTNVICIDEASDRIVPVGTPGATALFERGRPTALVQEAIGMCNAVDAAEGRTRAFVAMLDELGLLEPRRAYHTPPGGERTLVVEYDAVSRAKLDALAPAAFMKLRDQGALAWIYAHMLSAGNWDVLPLWAAG
ncbi:SapC family protein [Sphingomonas sp. H39-1-10]|uniref:SapC family protein n=1 Tax=Sphingomonas pollutisoli TaxID=3030829 RepID=UPI0023BA085D|nr:SapC family protein [Sphingomonas pollutisoli]MDF0489168.1 SapC family protein [Sphingomonas pollutisoli]